MCRQSQKGILFFHLFNPFSVWFWVHWQSQPAVHAFILSAHWFQTCCSKSKRTILALSLTTWETILSLHLCGFFALVCVLLNEYSGNTQYVLILNNVEKVKKEKILPLMTEMTDNKRWARFTVKRFEKFRGVLQFYIHK